MAKAAHVIGAALIAASSAEAYRYVDIRTNALVQIEALVIGLPGLA